MDNPENPDFPIVADAALPEDEAPYMRSTTDCSCGGKVPDGDTICSQCGHDHGLEREVEQFIRTRMM